MTANHRLFRIAAPVFELALACLALSLFVSAPGAVAGSLVAVALANVAVRAVQRRRTKARPPSVQRFEALVRYGSDVIMVVDASSRITYVSPSVSDMLGRSENEMIGAPVSSIAADTDARRVSALLGLAVERVNASMIAEWELPHGDGTSRHVEVLVRNLLHEPEVNGIVLNLRDVTERKELEDKLVHQALHDELTGLPNRSLLQVRIDHALTKWRFQSEPFCVLVIDIDDFKNINDSLGHAAGDAVLTTIAHRLMGCTRSGDPVVRLASDEFAILVEGVAGDDHEVSHVLERVLRAVGTPVESDGRQLNVRASVGIAGVSSDTREPGDILRNAELALHAAKSRNRSSFMHFESWMYNAVLDRIQLEADLRAAIADEGLQLYYQPTMDMITGRLDGAEALLRWPHPERGMVSPLEFIPIAEDSGLIVELGRWVLRQGCAELRKWHSRYPNEELLKLNINLSARQLAQADIVDLVGEVLEEFGIPPRCLVLEITESVLTDNNSSTLEKMNALVALGCQLAIDDFGTGYSSLSYLRQFPISVLKIDRSFVSEVTPGENLEQNGLVQAIIDVARTLRMKTVAEGIETAEQLGVLRTMGCDTGQGFLLARPAPAEDIRRLLESTYAVGRPIELPATST